MANPSKAHDPAAAALSAIEEALNLSDLTAPAPAATDGAEHETAPAEPATLRAGGPEPAPEAGPAPDPTPQVVSLDAFRKRSPNQS